MSFIKFAVKSVKVDEENRIVRATIVNKMDSSVDKNITNEIPLIMAALSRTLAIETNNHFTYTFPFKLS